MKLDLYKLKWIISIMKMDMKGQYHFDFSDFGPKKKSLDGVETPVVQDIESLNQLSLGFKETRDEIKYD